MFILLILPLLAPISIMQFVQQLEATSLPALIRWHPGVCFRPTEQTAALSKDQEITCVLAHAGQYPPSRSQFNHIQNQCCFFEPAENGIFWAIGESVMSQVIPVSKENLEATNVFGCSHEEFELHAAELQDILALDTTNDEPIPDVRITLSDDSVHLISYTKVTDDDGYAVFPVIPGENYVITMRADGYLPAAPQKITGTADTRQEYVVELDPGLSLSGTVLSPQSAPINNAHLHVEIERPDGSLWSSDIDQPRNISGIARHSQDEWSSSRSSWSTSENGRFRVTPLPPGKIRIFAEHSSYAPSAWLSLDAVNTRDLPEVTLTTKPPKHAWIRVESQEHVAISADLTILDAETGYEVSSIKTPKTGSLELKTLPEKVVFFAFSDSYAPLRVERSIQDHDEIILTLDQAVSDSITISLFNRDNVPLQNATLSLASSEQQKSHPLCLAKTDSQGKATLEFCPKSFWIDVFHPDYTHHRQFITLDKPAAEIYLSTGQDIQIAMIDEQTGEPVSDVTCKLNSTFTESGSSSVLSETIQVTDGHLVARHQADVPHKIQCTASPQRTITQEFQLSEVPESLKFPHVITRSCVVLDAFGAAIPYARIDMGNQQLETDETGRIHLTAIPNTTLHVYHWQHGHTQMHFSEGTSELELRLPDTPMPGLADCLTAHQMPHIQDSAAIQLDSSNKKYGTQRGDYAESCTDSQLVIVRDGNRIRIRW